MHGLINVAFQAFVTDAFGADRWHAVLHRAGLWDAVGAEGFEPLLIYDDAVTTALLAAAAAELARGSETLLEDWGTYLVSYPRTHRLRRLLRFGGVGYVDCLRALDDLPGRTRLAVPDFVLPALTLHDQRGGRFVLTCRDCPPGFGHVLLGVLRALADDYGALAVLDHLGRGGVGWGPQDERLLIEVHDAAYHQGRRFDLADAGAA